MTLRRLLKEVIAVVGVNKVTTAVIADNTANMRAAWGILHV